ncbi:haloalkane dehalogenase [Sorangium sp. So ce394]|uniref:haloalkane dehalogenase n=1 Tax=Sorangium sp. So ce394 TaxID=3133310 RepID=UPI003F5C92B1
MITQSEKKRARVSGHMLAYVDRGAGELMVFLHGNPTSSFLWRNIIAPLSAGFRCFAPDLIGMGDSDKLVPSTPDSYTFFQHRALLDGLLDELAPDRRAILVVHDWGSALGFDWARRHPERVRGIAYMEAIVGVMTWDAWPPMSRALFERLRSAEGDRLILEENAFIERILPSGVLRGLTEAELDEYRRPFRTPGESRRPTLSWPRQLPIEGHPAPVCVEVQKYADWLATSTIPKLFINADPGRILIGARRDACRRWPNQREVTVRGAHYVQEDSPAEIAEAIGDWARTLPP